MLGRDFLLPTRTSWTVILLIILLLLSVKIETSFGNSIRSRVNQGKVVNILILGIDARPGEVKARSDTIMLASINKKLGSAVLISIPRDTKVKVKGKNTKINMITQTEEPETCCAEVAKLLATEVDYYVLANFTGFENIIDIIGGVYLDVDIELSSSASGVYIKRGYQQLNGKQALLYARYRGLPDADIGRIGRQQKLMQALAEQLMDKENLSRIPQLIPELCENVSTNLSISDMIFLASLSPTINRENVITQTLPGYHYVDPYSGASYWLVDRQIAGSMIESLFDGHRFEVELEEPPWADW